MSQISKAANFIIEECRKSGIVVHRYDAKNTSSIYLKFDWGVAHSLRISDHKGIEKYHYRFNLSQGLQKVVRVDYRGKSHSIYYPFREIYKCLEDILSNRRTLMEEQGEMYFQKMDDMEAKINRLPREKLYPFWKYGKRVD